MTCLTAIGRLSLCVIALASTAPAFAQEFRATVTGRVTDPAGLAMPGVTVTAVNTQTNEIATAVTSAEGVYSLPFLKPGVYKVSAELEGFRKYEQDKVQLEVGQARTINIALQVGSAHRGGHRRQRSGRSDEGRPRHGHRQRARHRAAAERAQSVHAVVPLAGHHLQRAGDLSAAVRQRRDRRLVDQRRPEPQQRVPARRRAEQLDPGRQQHRLRAAGRRGAGVQDRHQQLRRAVRPHRGRRRQRVAEVGHQRLPRHGLRVRAPQGARLERVPLQGEQPARSPITSSISTASRSTARCGSPASSTAGTRRSSCSTTRATRRRRRTRRPTRCPTRRSCAATSATCATRRAG